jgi:GDP-D-mannose 3', 5'-epimerase
MKLGGQRILVCGAGGFIGGHLVGRLKASGASKIRAVDIKPVGKWYQTTPDVDSLSLDLQDKKNCYEATAGMDVVFQLAADMGGMGFVERNRALCMLSVLTNTHMLLAAKDQGVKVFFYSSSACVYNGERRTNPDGVALKEEDAYPAMPEDGYGWETLMSACADTLKKTLACSAASRDFITFTVLMALGMAAAKRPLLRSAAR